jgi:hypothetical protein
MNIMYPLIGSALVGALLVTRTKPNTKFTKTSLLGPKSGAKYQVEDFTDAGFIVVQAADGSRAVFQRRAANPAGGKGFAWQHGRGAPATLRAIYIDVMGEEPPKTAVGPKAVPNPKTASAKASAPGPRVASVGGARPKSAQATRGTP